MRAQYVQDMQQKIAEIAGVEFLQPLLIARIDRLAAPVGVAFVLHRIEIGRIEAAVLPPVDKPRQLPRGPALVVNICLGNQAFQEAQLVVRVDDRVIALKPDQFGMAAQHLGSDGVESAQPRHPFDCFAHQPADALAHLLCRLVGEGDAQDFARPGAPLANQMREAMGQRGGLPGARAGEHQDRPLGGQHSVALRRIEAGEPWRQIGRGGGEGTIGHR